MQRFRIQTAVVVLVLVATTSVVRATPYASGVTKSGTSVSFILNEPADSLKYSINGGALQTLDGSTIGTKMFTLGSASDTFSIVAEKNAASGYTIPTGGTVATSTTGLSQATNASGLSVVSTDTNSLNWFINPRGVAVSNNPNTSNFGTAYVGHGAAGSTAADPAHPGVGVRSLGDGMYALRADGSDPYGYGDNAQNPNTTTDGFPSFTANSSNSPFRVTVAKNGEVYVTDFADVNSNAFVMSADLLTSANLFAGFDGKSPTTDATTGAVTCLATGCPDGTGLPQPGGFGSFTMQDPGQNHGSVEAIIIDGSLAEGNLVVTTMDEDLNSAHVLADNGQEMNDRYSIWKYTINGATLPVSAMPTKVASPGNFGSFAAGGFLGDLVRGADGKFYYSQYRSAGAQAGVIVTDPSGTTIYDSLTASRTLLNDAAANDILRNVRSIAVSEDQKWLAAILANSDVAVVPLVNGLPDIANRLIVDTGTDVTLGRDIAFDAAGNIVYVSSGQNLYRVISPGGHALTTLAWTGTEYTFTSTTAGLTGDYNGDGEVDAADYVVWRDDPGAHGGAQGYSDWRANFGNPPGSGAAVAAAVPEPSSVLLIVCGLAFAGYRRHNRG